MSACSLTAALAVSLPSEDAQELRRARTMAITVSTALMIGNGACFVPETPGWYSNLMIVLTFACLAGVAITTMAAHTRRFQRLTRPSRNVYHRTHSWHDGTSGAGSRPTLTVVPGSLTVGAQALAASATPRPQLALIAGGNDRPQRPDPRRSAFGPVQKFGYLDADEHTDARMPGFVDERPPVAERERTVVTRADLDRLGSAGARAQNVAIARSARTLAPESHSRRMETSRFTARAHRADGTAIRTQLLRQAYEGAPATRRGDLGDA